jgi:IPT/TIG domain
MQPYISFSRLWIAALLLTAGLFSACEKDETGAPPTIERVRIVPKDSTTTSYFANGYVAIVGTNLATAQQVFFNDFDSYFNPTLVTETSIIVKIPEDAPWNSTVNKVRVVTKFGEVSSNFTIIQPAPSITDFNPKAASTGDIITITGTVFDNVSEVRFDNVVAEIVEKTSNEIKVKVPAGVTQAFIYVTTPGGTVRSVGAYGFALLIFGDDFPTGWWEGHWGGTADVQNTEVARGTKSMKYEYTGAWSGFQIGAGTPVNLSGYSAIKLSIYGGAGSAGQTIKVVISDNWGAGFSAVLTEGQWTDITIPLSAVGDPTELKTFIIQCADITSNMVIYVDDLGLI